MHSVVAAADRRSSIARSILLKYLRQAGSARYEVCAFELVASTLVSFTPAEALQFVDEMVKSDSRLILDEGRMLHASFYQAPGDSELARREAVWLRLVSHSAEVTDGGVDTLFSLFSDREAEYLVGELLERACGWSQVRITQQSQDEGLDVVGELLVPPGQSLPAAAQVKWYRPGGPTVGRDDLQKIAGAAGEGVAYLITSNVFTKEANAWAQARPRLITVDRTSLMEVVRSALNDTDY